MADEKPRRMTIRAVASHAGVSRQTISNALNAPERLTPETLARVQAAIAELDYRPDEAARALTSGRTHLLGIRVGQTAHNPAANPDPLLRAMVRSASRHGYRIIIFDAGLTDDDEIRSYDDLWRRGAVDGFVISDTHPADRRPAWLRSNGIPFAAFGSPWGEATSEHPWIDVDGAAGMRAVVAHLVEAGHTRIAFLGWPSDGAGGDARHDAWVGAMVAAGLPASSQARASEDAIEPARAAAARLLAESDPTAVVCASDLLAAGVARALSDIGRIPGRDVAVTGYDDSPVAVLSQPQLTSLRQPLDDVADFLVDHIVQAAGGAAGEPDAVMVAPQLIVRESSAPSAR